MDAALLPSGAADDPALVPDLDEAGCLRALSLLVDIGMTIALELKTPSGDLSPAIRAAAHERVATAVRRCIMLWRHLSEARPIPAPPVRRADARREIIRKVQDAIDRRAPADAGNLRLELLERLDAPEFEHDLATRSPAALIYELCRDLGLDPVVTQPGQCRRTPDDIAILCAQAAAPAAAGLARWAAALPTPPTGAMPPERIGRRSPAQDPPDARA